MTSNISIIMLKYFKKTKKWIKQNRFEFVFLLLILAVGASLRLYRIDEYMTFLGDEGRDAIIVRRLLVDGDIILIGPGTSIGNMYLGPLYYYLIAPALFLANYSPVGPAVMIALIGIATIFFVWYVSREWFGKVSAIIASLLYATSPVVVTFSRASWNPNIMPFFALLSIYSIWRVWVKKEFRWLVVLGIAIAFALQSHYLGLLLIPVVGLFWFLTFVEMKVNKRGLKDFFVKTILGAVIFLLLMSPLLIFDLRHDWMNYKSINKFFTERETTVSIKPWKALPTLKSNLDIINERLLAGTKEGLGRILSLITIIVLVYGAYDYFVKKRNRGYYRELFLILVWIAFGLIGLGLYKQHIYDHYYGFLFPAPFLLLGWIFGLVLRNTGIYFKAIVIFFTAILVFVNINNSFPKYPPNRQLQRAEDVVKKIVDESHGEKVNLAVLAERNYEDGYQYFLEAWNVPFVEIDPQMVEETVAQQLFVVCELPKDKCDPVNSPKAEVANFGWSKVDGEWEVAGVTLYRLIHAK